MKTVGDLPGMMLRGLKWCFLPPKITKDTPLKDLFQRLVFGAVVTLIFLGVAGKIFLNSFAPDVSEQARGMIENQLRQTGLQMTCDEVHLSISGVSLLRGKFYAEGEAVFSEGTRVPLTFTMANDIKTVNCSYPFNWVAWGMAPHFTSEEYSPYVRRFPTATE